ncbi:hypothetical protein GGS20DRAFT_596452 [Poronia punctata]|nr:hypothetical protein GGS20DRAFT_596452 [Poronia punctata]
MSSYGELTGHSHQLTNYIVGITLQEDLEEDMPVSPCTTDSRPYIPLSESELRARRENMPLTVAAAGESSSRGERIDSSHTPQVDVPRAVPWSPFTGGAIQQWREMSTPSSAGTRRLTPRRRRGGQAKDCHPLHCDESGSSSDDSTGFAKKDRDIRSYLKYAIRGFLRNARANRSFKDDGRKKLPDQECFIPSPKITFLIDRPNNLVCQVCQLAPLKMAITAEAPKVNIPALLPCGHITCQNCAENWLDSNKSCPFCRISMTHEACGHQVRPRLVAQDTVHTLPETLPNGGKIGRKCFKCSERDNRELSLERWAELAEKFKDLRREVETLGTAEAIKEMQEVQKRFERMPEDDYWRLTRMRHHYW